MKKEEKLKLLNCCKGTYKICRCSFKYSKSNYYYYVQDVSEKFFISLEEDDFIVDGFEIRKISDLKALEVRSDVCTQINEENKLLENKECPHINLNSWKDIFDSLFSLDMLVIVENEELDYDKSDFAIGKIISVNNNNVEFKGFDPNGNWYDGIVVIPYRYITSVTFNSRYCNVWEDYLKKNNKILKKHY